MAVNLVQALTRESERIIDSDNVTTLPQVSRLFESDSTSLSTPSGMTSGTVDETTNTLFMGGVYSEDTWACKLTQAQSAELKF